MGKYYDERFKKEIAKKYLSGEKAMDIVNKYGITKFSIYEWTHKYSDEYRNTTQNMDNPISSKEIRDLNLRIKENETCKWKNALQLQHY